MLLSSDLCTGNIVCSVEEHPDTGAKTYILSADTIHANLTTLGPQVLLQEFLLSGEFDCFKREFILPKIAGKLFRISPFLPNEKSIKGMIKLLQDTPDAYKTLLDGNPWSDMELLRTFSRYYSGVCNTLSSIKKARNLGADFPWTPDFDMCYVIYAIQKDGRETFVGRCGFRNEKDNKPSGTQVFYALSPQFWGCGLGRAVGSFLKQQWDQIFNEGKQGYLRGLVQSGRNPASARILESMGMKCKLGEDGAPFEVEVAEWNNTPYRVWEYPSNVLEVKRLTHSKKKEERIRDCANKETWFRGVARGNGG